VEEGMLCPEICVLCPSGAPEEVVGVATKDRTVKELVDIEALGGENT